MNIFIVRNGILKTPPVTEDILEGITRDSIIKIAKSLGYEVQETIIDKSELFIADEVFFTGTAAKVTPVQKIEQYELPDSHPIADAIKAEFDAIASGKSANFQEWTTFVKI